MGTWNTAIDGNDTFNEIYHYFFSSYNMGQKPSIISKKIMEEFGHMFNDHEDRNNSLFGLALAQWETKSLDPEIFKLVKEIIVTGSDLKLWQRLDADEKAISERKIVLEEFLKQISVEREKPKRRVKYKFKFHSIELISLLAPDGNKKITISEGYINEVYDHTYSMMEWELGGGSVFYFKGQGMIINAVWVDSQTLEIRHDKKIIFMQKKEDFFFYGDKGKVIYRTI